MKNTFLIIAGILSSMVTILSAISVRISGLLLIVLIVLKLINMSSITWISVFLIPLGCLVIGIIFYIIGYIFAAISFSNIR